MKILGISAFYHDSAAAIIDENGIIAAAQEERFSRKKHDPSFPHKAVKYCLNEAGVSLPEMDAVVFYDKPFLKFERLLETYYDIAPSGIRSFLKSMPLWIKDKLFLKKMLRDEFKKIGGKEAKRVKLLFAEHHLSHAASAFYPSGYKEAAVLTLDGVGEWTTTSICAADFSGIRMLKEIHFPDSLGLLYSAFTYFLGFRVNSGEYKLMGLAPYGNPDDAQTKEMIQKIREIITCREDGSFSLDMRFFDYRGGLKMIKEKVWARHFGFHLRKADEDLLQHHCNLAWAIQHITEDLVLGLVKEAKRLTGYENLCLAGGVALNCVSNANILRTGIFKNIFIQPAAGDAGGALGASLSAAHQTFGKMLSSSHLMKAAQLGPAFSEEEIITIAEENDASWERFSKDDCFFDAVAGYIDEGKVVGWFQGRMEYGPRALGNRSIIADPRNPEMQKRLNLKIKYRESFRPFAPSVLEEEKEKYFDINVASPFMLLTAPVQESRRSKLPENYNELPLKEKLYFLRSDIPAITHLDFSARLQTVSKDDNPDYWSMIKAFEKISGIGLVVNTSFNVRGEPIVCTPADAYRCFMSTDMDVLVMENFVFLKKDQPAKDDVKRWKVDFVMD